MLKRLAAALAVSILAAAPCVAFTVTVNTESYPWAFDNFLSLNEALQAVAEGPYNCMTTAEHNQFQGIQWVFLPPCWQVLGLAVGATTNDIVLFDASVSTIHVNDEIFDPFPLNCGDIVDGGRPGQPDVRIEFTGSKGVELHCADLERPDMQLRNLVLDHAATSGIFGLGVHGATIENVKVTDSAGHGLSLGIDPDHAFNPRRIQVLGSTFARNGGLGINFVAATGGPDDPPDHEITIAGNFVGVESLTDAGANGNGGGGIRMLNSRKVKIGGTPSQRNVVSGNTGIGIELSGAGVTGAEVFNNWVGVAGSSGERVVGNSGTGIRLSNGTAGNRIGQDSTSGNVVSGNGNDGITIDGAGTDANLVAGNIIGLNAAKTFAVPNGSSGVALLAGAKFNTIGAQTAKNVIAGNANRGVFIADPGTDSNEVRFNWIGVAGSNLAIPNSGGGVLVTAGTHSARIGPGNVISGNIGSGVEITGAATLSALIDGNTIGLDPAATTAMPNSSHGVLVHGGALLAEISGNTVSHNGGDCIRLADTGTNAGEVLGNWLTNCVGDGLSIQGAGATTVGGLADGTQPNNIYNNGGAAVRVSAGVGNRIRGNGMGGNAFEIALGPPSPPPGLAPNDAFDADAGGNLLQNSPVFLRAITSPTVWLGIATLYSAPSTLFLIDYYGGSCGTDGRGQPEYYLGAASFTTNASGFADISNFNAVHVTQSHLMATATDPAGNTSQISPCRAFNEPENLVFDDAFESGFVDGWTSWVRPQFP